MKNPINWEERRNTQNPWIYFPSFSYEKYSGQLKRILLNIYYIGEMPIKILPSLQFY